MLAASVSAQSLQLGPDVEFVISGTVQPRVSYGYQGPDSLAQQRIGAGLRRARFQTRATWRERAGFEFDFDGSPGTLTSVDLFAFYNFSDALQVRAGRQPGAQPRSYIPTSHTRIDIVERASIAERWAQGTIGSSGRDIGVDVEYAAGGTKAVLFLHNGTGSFDRGDGNFRESITGSSATRGREQLSVAVTAMAQHELAALPGVEIGAFGGYNAVGSEYSDEREYATGGVHAYWGAVPGSQAVRLKLDALGIRYEEVEGERQEAVGVSGFGAVRVLAHGEAFARYERFWSDLDADSEAFATVGGSYSPSAAAGGKYRTVRFTLAYSYRDDALGRDAHLAVLQGQFAF